MDQPTDFTPPEDEDLFDFPDMMPEPPQAASVAASSSLEPGPRPSSSAAPPGQAPGRDSRLPTLVPPSPPPPFDPELDVDLFHFDDLFVDQDVAPAGNTLSAAELLGKTSSDAPSGADVGSPHAPLPGPDATSASAASPTAAPSALSRSAPDGWEALGLAPLPGDARRAALEAAQAARRAAKASLDDRVHAHRPPASGLAQRLPLLAAGVVFLLLNGAVMTFAWRANDSFQAALDGVRVDVARTLAGLDANRPVYAEAPSGLERERATEVQDLAPGPVEGFGEIELRAAREELARREFVAARLRLYRLLANRDRAPLEEPLVATAEYLVGDSYMQEGRMLLGDER